MYYQDVSVILTVETKAFYSVNKLHIFVDKCNVKLRLFLTFVLSFFSFKSKACDLSPYLKIELFKKTPYKVEDIVCSKKNKHTYTFFIRGGTTSRKQQARFIKKILKDSGIEAFVVFLKVFHDQ